VASSCSWHMKGGCFLGGCAAFESVGHSEGGSSVPKIMGLLGCLHGGSTLLKDAWVEGYVGVAVPKEAHDLGDAVELWRLGGGALEPWSNV
jgi:hypothetical protein